MSVAQKTIAVTCSVENDLRTHLNVVSSFVAELIFCF